MIDARAGFAIFSIRKFLVLGPLEPENNVWLRYVTDPVDDPELGRTFWTGFMRPRRKHAKLLLG